MTGKIAIIGGTGLYAMLGSFETRGREIVQTPYGEPSSPLVHVEAPCGEVVFLARHGFTHRLPPHRINYRANIWMLKQAGVDRILAVNAVGSMRDDCPPAAIALPQQLIDYTWGREHSFFSDDLQQVTHVDFTHPYSEILRKTLVEAGENCGISLVQDAVYGCTQGPRLETAAEIRRLMRDGCDLVGMTGMPEAALARELEMEYASIAVSANWAAGYRSGAISMEQIQAALQQGMSRVEILLTETLK
jgi:5'-deoxy-5'-methylthioadenosine phosphorylase